MVPEKGWFIFGGNNIQVQVQSLSSIGSSWTTKFPVIYNEDPSDGHCAVQVSKLFIPLSLGARNRGTTKKFKNNALLFKMITSLETVH